MLERVRFNTADPQALASDLDRFVDSVRRELEVLERRSVRRYSVTAAPRTGLVSAKFEELCRIQTANGNATVLLPFATSADIGRSVLVDRMSASNVLKVTGSRSQLVNASLSVTLPAVVGAFPVLWTGSEWRTTEGQ
jgi:hypothetical protein